MFPILKSLHLVCVLTTFILFNLRFFLRLCRPDTPLPKLLRVLPHLNDTLLLALGVSLAVSAHWVPFGNALWLGVKLIWLAAYIITGSVCMKAPPRSATALTAYPAALLSFATVCYLAYGKPF